MDAAKAVQRRWWTLGVLCISLLVIALDNTILNVALPTLVRDLHASSSQLEWIVDAYTLVFAGLLLTAGSLGDRFGRRGALSIGLAIFGIGSALSAFSGSASALIVTRGMMGIGGALIMPATLSILTNVFTDHKERARAIGIWAAVSALGIAVGPATGGWLLQHFWWGSVFLINVPVVVVGLIGGRFLVPTSKDPAAPRLDPAGATLSILGLGALLYAIIEAPTHGWTTPTTLASFALATTMLSAFVAWELHTDHPMLDVRFFHNPRFSAASTAVTLVFFAMSGSLFFLSQYLQFVLGYNALQSGVRLIPIALAIVIAAPSSARIVERVGTKRVVTSGLVTVAAGLTVLSRMTTHSGYGLVGLGLFVVGVGMGLTMSPATESIMGSLPLGKAGVGSAVNDTTRQVGGALGVALLGSLLSSAYHTAMHASTQALPVAAAHAATDSLGGALAVASHLPGSAGAALASTAKTAFVTSMSRGLVVGAGIALIGALVAVAFLPARAVEPDMAEVEMEMELEGVAA